MPLLTAPPLASVRRPRPRCQPPAAVRRALPAGCDVLDAAASDLNRDAYPDLVVVLHRATEQQTSDVVAHPTKRPLLLFLGGPGHAYTLAIRSDKAVYCVDRGGMLGDPFGALPSSRATFRSSTTAAAAGAGRALSPSSTPPLPAPGICTWQPSVAGGDRGAHPTKPLKIEARHAQHSALKAETKQLARSTTLLVVTR